jgi:ribulose-phosphate 3-epimerase
VSPRTADSHAARGGVIEIAPSVLAADLGRLAEEVRAAERAGAARIHFDVMDGRFVSEITMGPVVARAIRRATALPLDVHLMIVEPERHLKAFAAAGATSIAVHQEACPHLYQAVQEIRALDLRPWVALNPATPPETIEWILPSLAGVLVMTVEPGSGGQPFIGEMVAKVEAVAKLRAARGLHLEIGVDGGIGPATARRVVEAGASVLVAGTAVFGAPGGVGAAISRLRRAAGTRGDGQRP